MTFFLNFRRLERNKIEIKKKNKELATFIRLRQSRQKQERLISLSRRNFCLLYPINVMINFSKQ